MSVGSEIEELLALGREARGFELKGPGPRTDRHLFAKVTRAALGMGNLRDGGRAVIGVDDAHPELMLPGLDSEDLAAWTDFDAVSRALAEYADPPLRFALDSVTLSSGASVAVLRVFEFDDVPHICAKAYQDVGSKTEILRKGAVYVRPRKVPETSELAGVTEMRELLDLATEKALRRYVTIAQQAGLEFTLTQPVSTDAELFDGQRMGVWQ